MARHRPGSPHYRPAHQSWRARWLRWAAENPKRAFAVIILILIGVAIVMAIATDLGFIQ